MNSAVWLLSALLGFTPAMRADTIRLYFDPATPQIAFAAGDIKAVLQKQKHEVQTHDLAALAKVEPGKRIDLAHAYKIRAATHLKANEKEKAKAALGTAYTWWIKYSTIMDSMFTGMTMQRSNELPNWRAHDEAVLKEYTDLGGTGIPN